MMVIVVVNILNIIGNYSLIFGKFGMPALGGGRSGYFDGFCQRSVDDYPFYYSVS